MDTKTMTKTFSTAALGLALVGCASCPHGRDDGYRPIFNGRDLSGWTGATHLFYVEDGELVFREGEKNYGNLFYEKELADFSARFQFKLVPNGNNGFAIRAGRECLGGGALALGVLLVGSLAFLLHKIDKSVVEVLIVVVGLHEQRHEDGEDRNQQHAEEHRQRGDALARLGLFGVDVFLECLEDRKLVHRRIRTIDADGILRNVVFNVVHVVFAHKIDYVNYG